MRLVLTILNLHIFSFDLHYLRNSKRNLAIILPYAAPMGLCWFLLLAFLAGGLKCLGMTISVHMSHIIKLQPLNCQHQRQLGRKITLLQFIVLR